MLHRLIDCIGLVLVLVLYWIGIVLYCIVLYLFDAVFRCLFENDMVKHGDSKSQTVNFRLWKPADQLTRCPFAHPTSQEMGFTRISSASII